MYTIKEEYPSVFLTAMKRAYAALKEKCPNSELLELVSVDSSGEITFSDKYRERFVDPRDDFGTFGYDRYTRGLEAALRS